MAGFDRYPAIDQNNQLPAPVRERMAANLSVGGSVENNGLRVAVAGLVQAPSGDLHQALLAKIQTFGGGGGDGGGGIVGGVIDGGTF